MENRPPFLAPLPADKEVADPLGDVGGDPTLPCISSSAVHCPGGDALVEPFSMVTVNNNRKTVSIEYIVAVKMV